MLVVPPKGVVKLGSTKGLAINLDVVKVCWVLSGLVKPGSTPQQLILPCFKTTLHTHPTHLKIKSDARERTKKAYLITRVRAIEGANKLLQPVAVGTSVLISKLEHLHSASKHFRDRT